MVFYTPDGLQTLHVPQTFVYKISQNHEKPQKLDKISEQKCVQNDHIFDKKNKNISIKISQTYANDHHSVMYDAVPEGEIMIIMFS